ncbi:MAG: PorT family protein [Bacteroidetes bacterium]|nr:PorT family protein [Bacteroidota bacterium]
MNTENKLLKKQIEDIFDHEMVEYNEAYWEAAEQLLPPVEKKRRLGGLWVVPLALALLSAGVITYLMSNRDSAVTKTDIAVDQRVEAEQQPLETNTASISSATTPAIENASTNAAAVASAAISKQEAPKVVQQGSILDASFTSKTSQVKSGLVSPKTSPVKPSKGNSNASVKTISPKDLQASNEQASIFKDNAKNSSTLQRKIDNTDIGSLNSSTGSDNPSNNNNSQNTNDAASKSKRNASDGTDSGNANETTLQDNIANTNSGNTETQKDNTEVVEGNTNVTQEVAKETAVDKKEEAPISKEISKPAKQVYKSVSLGLLAGFGMTNKISSNGVSKQFENITYKGGLIINLRRNNFSIETGALYRSRKGFDYKIMNETKTYSFGSTSGQDYYDPMQTNYLEIPVMINYHYKKHTIGAGFSNQIFISSRISHHNQVTGETKLLLGNYNLFNSDMGVCAQYKADISSRISIGIQGYMGIKDIINNDASKVNFNDRANYIEPIFIYYFQK